MTRASARALARFIPFAGWVSGGIGWAVTQQLGTDLTQENCASADPLLMVVIGLVGAAIALGGGFLSFRHWRNSDADMTRDYAGAHRFLALVSVMAAGLFLLAIVFQTLSSLIIPQCHA